MAYRVVLAIPAAEDLEAIVAFLEKTWMPKAIRRFLQEVDSNVALLSKYPYLFPVVPDHPRYRKCKLTDYHTLYYRINEKLHLVTVTAIFDGRRNPKSLDLNRRNRPSV